MMRLKLYGPFAFRNGSAQQDHSAGALLHLSLQDSNLQHKGPLLHKALAFRAA
jgi:hypothetical protein